MTLLAVLCNSLPIHHHPSHSNVPPRLVESQRRCTRVTLRLAEVLHGIEHLSDLTRAFHPNAPPVRVRRRGLHDVAHMQHQSKV